MPKLLYEYIYVNMWLLLVLALLWVNDGYISLVEAGILSLISIAGMFFVARKQAGRPDQRGSHDSP